MCVHPVSPLRRRILSFPVEIPCSLSLRSWERIQLDVHYGSMYHCASLPFVHYVVKKQNGEMVMQRWWMSLSVCHL